jgi:hypothetical protein
MAAVPQPMNTTAQAVYDAFAKDQYTEGRAHLGASLIGRSCERQLWYGFRWVKKILHDGRLLLIFQTGHEEEKRIVFNLRKAGIQVEDRAPNRKQWRIRQHGGHSGGSMDGAGLGFPEAPKTWHVLEVKTSNTKKFAELKAKGVQTAKPEHYVQMQVYMGETGMDRAMYVCKNKDTDELHTERVEFDQVLFLRMKAKAERIITADVPPARISDDPSWYECKMCDYYDVCHGDRVPQVNCRTCAHATPDINGEPIGEDGDDGGTWVCGLNPDAGAIPLEFQRTGCGRPHRFIPILLERVAGPPVNYHNGDVVYKHVKNGEQPDALTSAEIHEAGFAAPQLAQAKAAGFQNAKVVK